MKRDNDHVVNYHTKNGVILARDSKEKRYARIQPSYTKDEIIQAMRESPALSYGARGNAEGRLADHADPQPHPSWTRAQQSRNHRQSDSEQEQEQAPWIWTCDKVRRVEVKNL